MSSLRTSKEIIVEMERLYAEYEREVQARGRDGSLKYHTVRTYLPHSLEFIRWCKGEFVPGGRKQRKR